MTVAGRALDLDHVGAEVGEDLGAPGPGEHPRQVEHADAGERLRRAAPAGGVEASRASAIDRLWARRPARGHRDNRCDEPCIRPARPGLEVLWLPAALIACSPALDWREVRPEGSARDRALSLPPRHARAHRAHRRGATLRMQLHSCDAAGSTFSLAVVDGAEPTRVEPLLAALKASVAANIGGTATRAEPFAPPGATPNPSSALASCAGPAARRPAGRRCTPPSSSTACASTRRRRSARTCPKTRSRSFFGAIKVTP